MQGFHNCNDVSRVDLNVINQGRFQIGEELSEPTTQRVLKELYTYPQRIKIKWGAIDELNDDLFLKNRHRLFKQNFPFIDFFEDYLAISKTESPALANYSTKDYIEGYLNKIATSNFYSQRTQKLQDTLAHIPVYTIVNGFGELALARPRGGINVPDYRFIASRKYETAGAFDPDVSKSKGKGIGLFFFNLADAELYLKEMGVDDLNGIEYAGLSIRCIGLNSAYKVTREQHPEVDFRFVPDYREVNTLLSDNIGKPELVVEDQQQQLRFRRRPVPLKGLGEICNWLTPFNSFVTNNEYFKGVPIFIVRARATDRSRLVEAGQQTFAQISGLRDRIVNSIDYCLGFGDNRIMQGSLLKAGQEQDLKTYVFFEKEQAVRFSKSLGRKISRYGSGRSSLIGQVPSRREVMVYNFEDFVELWEDAIIDAPAVSEANVLLNGVFNFKSLFFVPPASGNQEFRDPPKINAKKQYQEGLSIRWLQFKGFLDIFFGMPSSS